MTRREKREQAFLLLFEWMFKNENLEEIIESAQLARDIEIDDFSKDAFNKTIENVDEIDLIIERNVVGWKKERLSKVMISALRLSIFEMLYKKDIPKSVSINEAVEIVKKYGTKEDASFVNGILSGAYKEIEKKNA